MSKIKIKEHKINQKLNKLRLMRLMKIWLQK